MIRRPVHFTRSLAILRIQRDLQGKSFPRLQMGLIVGLTGLAGWLASYSLLSAGIGSMAARYPLALTLAYAVFLFLLWLWIHTKADEYGDFSGFADVIPGGPHGSASSGFSPGGGGDFAGGGATASYDQTGDMSNDLIDSNPLASVADVAGAAAEADEFAVPLLALILTIGLALASMYVIYVAPALLAELLLDGALSFALYRHLRGNRQHWLETAIRKTVVPFALTALLLFLVGLGLSAYAPGSHSLSEAIHFQPK